MPDARLRKLLDEETASLRAALKTYGTIKQQCNQKFATATKSFISELNKLKEEKEHKGDYNISLEDIEGYQARERKIDFHK